MKYYKKLEGNKIYLSPINKEDYSVFTEWINNLENSIRLGNSTTTFSAQAEINFLEKASLQNHIFFVITKNDDKVIGSCSFYIVDHLHQKGELGIFLGEPFEKNKGYGSEAVQLLVEYGFKILNLHSIMLKVFSFNVNAIHVYEKIGFKRCGVRREAYLLNGKWYDELFYDILSSECTTTFLDNKLP